MKRDPDFQHLLPAAIREKWAVVPRFFLYQLFAVGVLLGAGVALSIFGFVTGNNRRWLAFLIALVLAWLQNKLLAARERRLVQAAMPQQERDAARPSR